PSTPLFRSHTAQVVTLDINNLDEVAPVITSAATATSIDENSGSGQVVYTATATDNPDASHPSDGPSAVTFSLGSAGGDEGAFSINGTTGKMTLTGDPNFEGKPSYSFDVIATDAAGNHTAQVVTLDINDVNEAPTLTSGATGCVAENAASSTVVYTATATDPDTTAPNNTISWSLTGADAALLSINSSGQVTLNSSANFEA